MRGRTITHASDDVAHFARGGVVGGASHYASGGAVDPREHFSHQHPEFYGLPAKSSANTGRGDGGASMAAAMSQFSNVSQSLAQSFTQFGGNANALASAISQMPRQISHTGHQTLDVTLNGAEILSSLVPSLKEMVLAETQTALSRMLKRHLPDAGVPN